MINVTVNDDPENKDRAFPKLMKSHSGSIVWFVEPEKGTCVVALEKTFISPGEYSDDWNMSHFTDFTGSVTLRNEP